MIDSICLIQINMHRLILLMPHLKIQDKKKNMIWATFSCIVDVAKVCVCVCVLLSPMTASIELLI